MPNNKKYKVNHNYFKSWSRNMAYIFGFWCADGSIIYRPDNYQFRFRLGTRHSDVHILEDINSEMESNHKIYNRKKVEGQLQHHDLEIYSRNLVEDLINLGGLPRKSLALDYPSVPMEFLSDFTRGYFDGDGCITKSGSSWVAKIYSASPKFANGLNKALNENILGLSSKVYSAFINKGNSTVYNIHFSPNNARRLCLFMYQKSPVLFMKRRLAKFVEAGIDPAGEVLIKEYRQNILCDLTKNKLEGYFSEGETFVSLAKRFNVVPSAIRQKSNRLGIDYSNSRKPFIPMTKETKITSDHASDFPETLDHKVACCGNIEGNNNKYYSLEVQKNPTENNYRLLSHYGRIGSSSVYGTRGPYHSYDEAKSDFDKIIAKKLRGKNIKEEDGTSRREHYELVELLSPTVGSPNVRGRATANAASQVSAAQIINEASKFDPDVQRLIDQFAQENIHKITSLTGSSITLTANGLETALGPITMTTIGEARRALNDLKDMVDGDGRIDPDKEITRLSNNFYYSKVPHSFGRKITKDDWIITDAKLAEEYDLLDQLAASVQMGLTTNTNASKQLSGFDTDIEPIDKKTKVFKDIVGIVDSTKKHSHLTRWRVKNAYIVKIGKERARYEKAEPKFGNVQEFFHGSQNANILSILLGGLIIPPVSAGHVTGRMFGNGIYGANSSTKSLNYSVGGWSGRRNTFKNSFLFRCKFAMGKTFETGSGRSSGPPTGYDSVTALARMGGLYNDEFIVYKLEQCTITHLIELEE